jgi:Holliday junction resolvase-like predicted endonuclease
MLHLKTNRKLTLMHIPSKGQLKKISKFKNMPWDNFTASFLLEDPSSLEAFLYSKALFKFPQNERKTLLNALKKSTSNVERKLFFQYLIFSFDRLDYIYEESKKLIVNCSIENILSYWEFGLNKMIKTNRDINGVTYPKEIIESKYDFAIELPSTLLYIAKKENLPISTNKLLKDNEGSIRLILTIANYHSIKKQIVEVMKGAYIPKKIEFLDIKYGPQSSKKFSDKCKYFLQRAPENLDSIELYNDLNYTLSYQEEREVEESISTMKEAGAIKNYIEGEFIHFDMSKTEKYDEVLKIKKITELMNNIYGSIDSEVSYQNIIFTIKDMIGLVKKISKLSDQISDHRRNQCKHSFIYKQSLKNIFRHLSLSQLEKNIFPFFCADLNAEQLSDISYCPFIKADDMYLMLTPITTELSYEKVLDKILSRKGFKVRLPQKYKEKGIMFEDKIIDIFSKKGFAVGQIKRNAKKNIPEIDGVVHFDDETILVIEAKCTIKPETRPDVFNFVENHLSKAVNQLTERVLFLTSNPHAANERLKFPVDNKKVIPIIVTNHSFFSGHKFVQNDGVVVHCIDELLLNKIISHDYIPSWEHTGIGSNYVPVDKTRKTIKEKLEAIINPVANLLGKEHRTIQPLSYGVAFEIYKQPHIDRLEQLKRRSDVQGAF